MNFTNTGLKGADVSYWQDVNTTPQQIDFSKMIKQGAAFVIVRAGQNLWPDPDFAYNWRNAKYVGLLRGTYFFYDSRVSPEQQATLFANQVADDKPELEMWLDVEENFKGPYQGYANWKKFIDKLQKLIPTAKIGIYTSYGYIKGKIPTSEYAYFSKLPLWLAWWTYKDGVPYPIESAVTVPAPWTSCLYWQWGTPAWGLAWGCESKEIDQNLFNGTYDDFLARYNVISKPPEGDDDMITEAMWSELLSRLDNIEAAIKGSGGSGGGTTPLPSVEKESDYNVVEKDANINGLVVAYKTPDINETNVDRFPVKPPQVVTAINDWKDVPAGLVGWSNMSDIDKQNTYREWVCLHEKQIKQANGKWREFPDIFLQNGAVRAEYCWMLRSCLGSKV